MFIVKSLMKTTCSPAMGSSAIPRHQAHAVEQAITAPKKRNDIDSSPFAAIHVHGPLHRQLFMHRMSARFPVLHHATLKDGRIAVIRKLTLLDREKLDDFLDRADFLSAGGAIAYHIMGKAAARQYELTQIFGSLTEPGHGVLLAEVDSRIEGLCEFAPLGASSPESSLARIPALGDLHACVSTLSVTPDAKGIGIGSALKKAQMQCATKAGYQAIVAETDPSNHAMLHIVGKLGGKVIVEDAGPARTVIPLSQIQDRDR